MQESVLSFYHVGPEESNSAHQSREQKALSTETPFQSVSFSSMHKALTIKSSETCALSSSIHFILTENASHRGLVPGDQRPCPFSRGLCKVSPSGPLRACRASPAGWNTGKASIQSCLLRDEWLRAKAVLILAAASRVTH